MGWTERAFLALQIIAPVLGAFPIPHRDYLQCSRCPREEQPLVSALSSAQILPCPLYVVHRFAGIGESIDIQKGTEPKNLGKF